MYTFRYFDVSSLKKMESLEELLKQYKLKGDIEDCTSSSPVVIRPHSVPASVYVQNHYTPPKTQQHSKREGGSSLASISIRPSAPVSSRSVKSDGKADSRSAKKKNPRNLSSFKVKGKEGMLYMYVCMYVYSTHVCFHVSSLRAIKIYIYMYMYMYV